MEGDYLGQENVSAEADPSKARARISCKDEDSRWSRGPEDAQVEGTKEAYSSIGGRALQRRFRLTKEADFRKLRDRGRSWANPLVVLYALPNEFGVTRVGVSASKRIGGAVTRNRVKRLIKEAFRLRLNAVKQGWDVLFIARQPTAAADFRMVSSAVEEVLRRAGLLERAQKEAGHREVKDTEEHPRVISKES